MNTVTHFSSPNQPWGKSHTPKRYLHPPFAENIVTMWPTENRSMLEALIQIGDFEPYINAVMRTYFDIMQAETGESGLTLEGLLSAGNEEERMVERLALREAIANLPERERQVIFLRYYKGLTQDRAARVLGTDVLRLWCGGKDFEKHTPEELAGVVTACREAAALAEAAGMTLCLECHPDTCTNSVEGARFILRETGSPALGMYFQPNQFRSLEENLTYAEAIAPVTRHLHVFHWIGKDRFPLADGADRWRQYLERFPGDHALLLEFMPDNDPASVAREAQTLRDLIKERL